MSKTELIFKINEVFNEISFTLSHPNVSAFAKEYFKNEASNKIVQLIDDYLDKYEKPVEEIKTEIQKDIPKKKKK